MKDNHTMSAPKTTEAAEAEERVAVTDLGKFKDVKALLEAYQALEAEFTRRSQKLKELEASKEREATAERGQVKSEEAKAEGRALPQTVTLPKDFAAEQADAQAQAAIAQAPSAGATAYSGGGAGGATLSEMSEQMKNAVIEEYLNGVFSKRGVPFITGGGAVSATRRTPKNVREAGALANKLFKNKEDK